MTRPRDTPDGLEERSQEWRAVLDVVVDVLRPLVPADARHLIRPESSLITDLGMDSLKVVELSLGLEERLERPVFLPEWIAQARGPSDLTVASLAEFALDGA